MADFLKPFPTNAQLDRHLARVQFQNAKTSLRSAEFAIARGNDDRIYYALAIAIELALKAYLLAMVTDDDWNRVHIRHDLAKVVAYARRAGLVPPAELPTVITLVHPHFQNGGFHGLPSREWPPGFAPTAFQIVCGLLACVAHATSLRLRT